jgi:uncharacterized protein
MGEYKTSKYNTVHKTDYGLILFNTFSCGLLKITDSEVKTLNPLNADIVPLLAAKNSDYNKTLINHGFLVENDVDEFALFKSRLYRYKYSTSSASLTINTGLACNCRCVYCYEGQEHISTSIMTSEKATDIITFIKDKFPRTTRLSLSFVGGEPLLCFDVIKLIYSELVSIFDHLALHITTNGVLLDEISAMYLKETKSNIQISIDGLKHHHDKKRTDIKGNGTYDKIITNIKILQDADIPISIRTNIDQDFMDNVDIKEWIETLKTDFDLTKKIIFYVAPVVIAGKGTKAANEIFINHMITIYEAFIENQIPFNFNNAFNPSGGCFITHENNYSINCNGDIYKCWHDVSSENFNGRHFDNIYKGINWAKLVSYTNSLDVLEDHECRNCVYLPVCSGGCPEYVVSGNSKCTPLKHYHGKMLSLFMRYKGYSFET